MWKAGLNGGANLSGVRLSRGVQTRGDAAGGWRAVTKQGGHQEGPGGMDYNYDMPPYVQQIAEWLDDDRKVHPCCFAHAYQGFEIMSAFYRSVAGGGQIPLPLASGADEIGLLKARLPERKVLLTLTESAKEYPG